MPSNQSVVQPFVTAILSNSAAESTPSLRRRLRRCVSTVRTLILFELARHQLVAAAVRQQQQHLVLARGQLRRTRADQRREVGELGR